VGHRRPVQGARPGASECLRLALLATAVPLIAGCPQQPPPTPPEGPFSYVIDQSIEPMQDTILGPAGESPVVARVGADGRQYDYVGDQVVLLPTSDAQLAAFLARHDGTVVSDYQEDDAERTVVVRLDPSGFPLDRLVEDAERAGIGGEHRFSSQDAVRLMALVLRERAAGLKVTSDGLHAPLQSVLLSTADRGAFNALAHAAFTGPAGARLADAWQYLAGHRVAGPLRRVNVAIVDGGFWVDAAGASVPDPANGQSDLPANPVQRDFVNGGAAISGMNAARCSGGSVCPWHGHGSASVATGTLGNGAYRAGTGGMVADAVLLNVNLSSSQVKAAVDAARGLGADVMNMSFGGPCDFWCDLEREIAGYYNAFERAANAGIFMVASAGNSGQNATDENYLPCALPETFCVGALGSIDAGKNHVYDTNAREYSNYGSVVDLFAPTEIPAWYGTGATPDLGSFGGTSASAPYVSGVVAMMLSVAPDLTPGQVRQLLLDTARTDSTDPKVGRYLDAYAAVRAAAESRQPPDRFEPNDSAALATNVSAGTQDDLTIGAANDADFYRLAIAGPSTVTVGLVYPTNIGKMSMPPFGMEGTQTCGFFEQNSYVHGVNALDASYRLSTGSFVFSATSPGNPLPYRLNLATSGVAIAADAYEPNDTFGAARTVPSGYVNATLHSASDVDFYYVFSNGNFSTMVLTMSSRARIEDSDVPLTLTLYDGAGNVVATSTSSADCATQAVLTLPSGFQHVSVSGAGPAAYRVFLGSHGTQHPLIDIEELIYLELHPNVPVEMVVRRPEEWVVFQHVSDFAPQLVELLGQGLHMSVYDEAGETLLGEGVTHQDGLGETLDLSGAAAQPYYLLRLSRTVEAVGDKLPTLPATLMASD
jgi:hypothetical protein